jgi:hypothetical protein
LKEICDGSQTLNSLPGMHTLHGTVTRSTKKTTLFFLQHINQFLAAVIIFIPDEFVINETSRKEHFYSANK